MNEKKYSASVCTLGCRVNQYESEAVKEKLVSLGFEIRNFDDVCDVYIVNTCAVTGESDRKSRQMIRHCRRLNADGYVIVMGCYAQTDKVGAAALGADCILGNRNKLEAADIALNLCERRPVKVMNVVPLDHAPYESMSVMACENTRAFVKIEDGCDNHCSYCIIREARGPVVSRKTEDVVEEVKKLASGGYKEVVLTGVETASYGKDTGEDLGNLIRRVAAVDGIERIRLGSMEPSALTDGLIDTLSDVPKFMPSFHLSLQSGSSRILALMKRKYNIDQVMGKIHYIRQKMPGVTFTADIIAGFPGETKLDFDETFSALQSIHLLHIHAFPYSKRKGTPAALMDGQIPKEVKHDRVLQLNHLSNQMQRALYAGIATGTVFDVLFESPENGIQVGHTPELYLIHVKTDESLQGRIRKVKVTSFDKRDLWGELV